MSTVPSNHDAGSPWILDGAAITRMVGAETARRGRSYWEQRAVRSFSASPSNGTRILLAEVQGSAASPYNVVVRLDRKDPIGQCSCPMRTNCKHVAAVLYESLQRLGTTKVAAWDRLLGGMRSAAQDAAISPLAIQFELTRRPGPGRSGLQIEIRPVVPGASGRWVRSGVTWSSLRYSQYSDHKILDTHHRLLQEVLALNSSSRSYPYNYGNQERVFLDAFPSRRIWDILSEARAAGIALINAGKAGDPVELIEEPAVVSLDIDSHGDELTIRPLITVARTEITGEHTQLLGKPGHGIAWWTEAQGSTAHPEANDLSIAPLDRILDGDLLRLFTGDAQVTIPADDKQRFLRDFYPGLRTRVALSSRNRSFEPPAEETRLLVRVRHAENHHVSVAWSWTHSVGGAQSEQSLWQQVLLDPRDAVDRHEILTPVEQITVAVAGLYHDSSAGHRLLENATLSGLDAIVFTRDVLPGLRDLKGVDVLETGVPVAYREATDAPQINLTGKQGATGDWFDLSVTVSVDGEEVPFQKLFLALAANQAHLVLPSGTYFSIDRPELHQLRALIAEARGLTDQRGVSLRLSRFQAGFWAELEALGVVSEQAAAWAATVGRLNNAQITVHPLPTGLNADLRPYQSVGFNWLVFLHEHGLGGVLADDMGLGKTVQALALICQARERDAKAPPFLVVAPTSVVGNWVSECHRFTPGLKALAITETEARRGVSLRQACRGVDVVVTSYALFRIEFEEYEKLGWSGLLLDEAQAIKNHQSRGYLCARRLRAPFKLAITGTPMENNLTELWSMFSITAPGLFADPAHFNETYRNPIEREGNTEQLERLQRRMKPLLLRRTKEQVAADLPEKLEQVLELDLNPRHRRVYQTYLQRERQKVLGLIGDMQKNRFEIFRSLTLLRQVSIDPSLVDPKHRTVPSTKLDALMEQIDDVVAEGHRALVFSQFTRFLGHVRDALDSRGIPYCYLDGSTRNRPLVLEQFKTGKAPLFLISLKAGGVGLNLTEADYCFLLDPWWNPAAEAQAVDRAHRIGQTRKVMVYRLVARDTIEEKVMALKAKKQALFSSVIDGGGATSSALTAADIKALLD